jgi:hypothetical protein
MSLLNRSCSLFAGLALWCSPMAGSAQLSGEAKEKGGALGSKTPKVEPAHRTGFSDIAPYLSADGAMLSFYDTREIVADADEILSFITKTMVQQATKDEGTKTGAKILNLLYETSGAKSLAAIGSSSVPRGNQLFYNRKYIARTAGDKKAGFIWNALTEKTARLSGLDLLPSTTAWAWFGNVDLTYIDSLITKISAEAGSDNGVEQMKQRLEKSGVKWGEILASLDNEVGVVLLMDPKKTIRVPAGPMALEMPHPSGGIILRTKSDYVYKRIAELGGANGPKEEEIQGVKFLSQAVSNPVVPDFAPTIALVDPYLVIASSRELPLQLAATLRGKTPGLRVSEEFKLLSQDVPVEGSAFSFASKRFCDSIRRLLDQAIATVPGPAQADVMKQMSGAFLGGILPEPSFTVYQRIGADWLVTSNGPQNSPMGATASAGTIGLLSAIAVPNFLRARTRSQATQILESARILDAAVDQYAIEHNIKGGSPVAFKDIVPYLRKDSQLALSGGKDVFGRPYILKPVDGGIRIHPDTIQQLDKNVVPPDFFKPFVD